VTQVNKPKKRQYIKCLQKLEQ